MAHATQYLPFGTGSGANTLSYSAYFATKATVIDPGYVAGVADAQSVNTTLRQLSVGVAGLAKFAADYGTRDMNDDGSVGNFEAGLLSAIDARIDDALSSIVIPTIPYVNQGTFTPTLAFGGSSTGITYSARDGRWSQVGKTVTFFIFIQLTSKGSASGDATFNVPANSSGNYPVLAFEANMADLSGTPLGFVTTGSLTGHKLQQIKNTTGAQSPLNEGNFTNSSTLYITGTYLVP